MIESYICGNFKQIYRFFKLLTTKKIEVKKSPGRQQIDFIRTYNYTFVVLKSFALF